MKKLFQALLVACLYTTGHLSFAIIEVTLNRTNAAPINDSDFPVAYGYTKAKEQLQKGQEVNGTCLVLSATPFYSQANKGTNLYNTQDTNLMDLSGRTNMFGIMQTVVPTTYSNPANVANITNLLGAADATGTITTAGTIPTNLLNSIQYAPLATPSASPSNQPGINYFLQTTPQPFTSIPNLESMQTEEEIIGYLSIPTKYRRYGSRFEFTAATDIGIGFNLKLGVASISQRALYNNEILFGNVDVTTFNSSTSTTTSGAQATTNTIPNAAYYLKNNVRVLVQNPFNNGVNNGGSTVTPTEVSDAQWYEALRNIRNNTANQLKTIAKTIGLNLNDFQKTGIEDLRAELFWRKGFKLQTPEPVVFIPYLSLFTTLDVAGVADANQLLAVPFGNNGHASYGGQAGFTLDFNDNFEIGSVVGVSGYTSRNEANMRMPNAENQSVIYPYTTSAKLQPGNTWYASLLINSHHFEEDLSFFMQYLYVGHSKDKITLNTPDDIFLPEVLEGKSIWNTHVANLGLNYEVSPSVMLGCAGQIPLKQFNAYRSSSFVFSIIGSY